MSSSKGGFSVYCHHFSMAILGRYFSLNPLRVLAVFLWSILSNSSISYRMYWHHLYPLNSLTVGDRMQIRNILCSIHTLRRVRMEDAQAICGIRRYCPLLVNYVFIQCLPHDPCWYDVNTKNVHCWDEFSYLMHPTSLKFSKSHFTLFIYLFRSLVLIV